MADFTPINTQAEFDAAIADRLARQQRALEEKYKGFVSAKDAEEAKAGFEKQIADLTKQLGDLKKAGETDRSTIAQLQAKVKGYETDSVKTRIAHETGLPYSFASRLVGESEDEIRKDAEQLRSLIGSGQPAPLQSHEPGGRPGAGAPVDSALMQLARDLGPKT